MGSAKWFFRSKTIWVNVLIGAAFASGLPVPDGLASADALQAFGVAAPAANGVMRFATREALGAYGKRVIRSKTIWLNLALLASAGLALSMGAGEVGGALIGIAGVNLVLRKTTTSPVSFAPHPFSGRRSAY